MEIINRPIEDLVEYARNPRKNDHAVDRIASAIKEYGFRVPIVAKSDGLIVDGHLRYKAAKKLGMKEVPTVSADDMTEAQIKAFRISVNRMADLADWDWELLKIELEDIVDMGLDLDITGFDLNTIDSILGKGLNRNAESNDNSTEVDVESFEMQYQCPRCGFEFDKPVQK